MSICEYVQSFANQTAMTMLYPFALGWNVCLSLSGGNPVSYFALKAKKNQEKVNDLAVQHIKNLIDDKFAEVISLAQRRIEIIINESEIAKSISIHLKTKQVGIIYLSTSTLNEATQGDLCDSCKFVILHEAAHIIFSDEKNLRQKTSIHSITLLGLGIYFFSQQYSLITSYAITSVIGRVFIRILNECFAFSNQRQETIADLFAVKKNKSISYGAISFFTTAFSHNIYLKSHSNSILTRLKITSTGDDRLDFAHPSFWQRIGDIIVQENLEETVVEQVMNKAWLAPNYHFHFRDHDRNR